MFGLAELQARFVTALQDAEVDGIDTWVNASGISASRRVAVYRNNSRISQTEALAGIYAAVQQLVGQDFFEQLAIHYNRQHPSTSGDLREYGRALATFLSSFEPVDHLHYLPDVARLEWAWHECFHAAAAAPVSASYLTALAARTDGEARLSLIPASRLLTSPYPIADIWSFALDPERQQQGLNLDALDEARLLITRPEVQVHVMELTTPQFFCLERIAGGEPLGIAFEQTLLSYPEFNLAAELASFVRLGVLTKSIARGTSS